MKKLLLFLVIAGIASSSVEVEAWRGRRYGGYHRGYGRYGRGYGWGWGPSFAFTVPVGSSGPKLPPAVRQYNKLTGNPKNFRPSASAFCNWAPTYFTQRRAQGACDNYKAFLRNAPAAGSYAQRASFSIGVGGGYGSGYWGGPYRRRWWW